MKDSTRQSALLYHLLTGEEPSIDGRLEQLFERLFAGVFEDLTENVVSIARTMLESVFHESALQTGEDSRSLALEKRRLAIATKTVRACSTPTRTDILHDLNLFLSSHEFKGTHVKTGTIFRSVRGDIVDYWVSATANCSLVPRTPTDKESWEAKLFPNFPLIALRLQLVEGRALDEALSHATSGRLLFVQVDHKRVALRLANEIARQPRPEIFIVTRMDLQKGQRKFHACRIEKARANRNAGLEPGSNNEQIAWQAEFPSLVPYEFEAIAQLRPSYADRVLTQTGQHSSRIGVDFVNSAQPEGTTLPS